MPALWSLTSLSVPVEFLSTLNSVCVLAVWTWPHSPGLHSDGGWLSAQTPSRPGHRGLALRWTSMTRFEVSLNDIKAGYEFLSHYRGNRVRLIMFLISLPFVNVRIPSVREFSGGRSRNPYTQWTHWWLTPFIINHSTANPIRFLNLFI